MRMTTFLLLTLATGLISACDDHLDFLGPDGSQVSSRDGIHGSVNIVTESRSARSRFLCASVAIPFRSGGGCRN